MSKQARMPTYEDLVDPAPGWVLDCTPQMDSILCTMNGPLESSVWVIAWGSLISYAQRSTDDGADGNPTWHPISQCSITESKVSSITVTVDDLYHWKKDWLGYHRQHVGLPGPKLNVPDFIPSEDGYVFEPLEDYDTERDEGSIAKDRPLHLLYCFIGDANNRPKPLESLFFVGLGVLTTDKYAGGDVGAYGGD
ncbi:hypothetical protein F4777DRAFT_580575 [Nemania sp. FL0916]|nr:hypothetical protein F4777DRAFT_580575 [Nemania sp. FL0916]